jgi:hypothetical protein
MGEKRLIKATLSVGLACCLFASNVAAQSLSDRFKSLFGGSSDQPATSAPAPAPGQPQTGQPQIDPDLVCPPVQIRAGASTFAVAAPGKQPVGNDLRFQATITKTARECQINGSEIIVRVGIQGRVIAGPAGAPSSIQIPLRVAVVQGGVSEKTIATKAYQTTVTLTESGSDPFTLVADDLVYPAPSASVGDTYVFYIGFDPQALKPEPKPRATKKK